MKSVVTRWEPLAMALNSTPSRSMSFGRHHSSMFPRRCPTPQRENVKKQTSQTNCLILIQVQTVNTLSTFHYALVEKKKKKPTVTQLGWQLSKHAAAWWEQGDGGGDSARRLFTTYSPATRISQLPSCRNTSRSGTRLSLRVSIVRRGPKKPHLRPDPRDAPWSLWELCLALGIAKCQSRLFPVQRDQY